MAEVRVNVCAGITIREHGDVPGQGSSHGQLGCPGLCITSPTPHWMRLLESLPRFSPGGSIQESCLAQETVELMLVARIWMSRPGGHKCGRVEPHMHEPTHLPWGDIGAEVMPHSHPNPSPPPAVRNAAHGAMSSGGLALPFTSCSIQESRPCTSPGQHDRAGPEGDAGESTPRANAWENWPCHPSTVK